jgi:Site-specific DNA methylase
MNNSNKPLIKWPGGKSAEFGRISDFLPPDAAYDRYIEPFLGGGAVFWRLRPTVAVLNDISAELMDFYRFVGDKQGRDRHQFEQALYGYVEHWQLLDELFSEVEDELLSAYTAYSSDAVSEHAFKQQIEQTLTDDTGLFAAFDEEFCVDRPALVHTTVERLQSKLVRTSDKIDQENEFPEADVLKNVEAGLKGGFYTHFRSVLNKAKLGSIELSRAREVANYFFIREFCYGSMFRYNASGEFNIPYGGIAYNDKDIEKKVDRIFSEQVKRTLGSADVRLHAEDFERLLDSCGPTENDFVFLDPPYDTDFSGYNNDSFTKTDHRRLADWLHTTPAQFVLVIKNTELIQSLYVEKERFQVESFQKQYAYNVRDRNEQSAEHLIVHSGTKKQTQLTDYGRQAEE